jgi:hypothetical protein
VFAECDTRQRELGEQYIDNGFFVEYFLSGKFLLSVTWYSTKSRRHGAWYSAKRLPFPSVPVVLITTKLCDQLMLQRSHQKQLEIDRTGRGMFT